MGYRIVPEKLEVLRGKLMGVVGHDVSWSQFAELCGITLNTCSNIRHNRSTGSARTVERIINSLLQAGLVTAYDDLLETGVPFKTPQKPPRRKTLA